MKISVLEAPVNLGSPTSGSQYAFNSLVSEGLGDILGEDTRFLPMPMTLPEISGVPSPDNMKDLWRVMGVSRTLSESVKSEIQSGRFPIIIGGDHSCAIGSIAGASAVYGEDDLSVIYIDGHTDINTENTTVTGYIHGMTLASAMGLCCDELTVGRRVNLYGKNIFIVGARSIDPAEYEIIEEQNVTLYGIDEVKRRGISAIMEEIAEKITTSHIHVSFDVDFADGDEFPSTGYRMPNGATFDDACLAVSRAFEIGHVCSMDVVEYNPTLDDGTDRNKLFRLFEMVRDLTKKLTVPFIARKPDSKTDKL